MGKYELFLGGGVNPSIIFNLKKNTGPPDYQPMSPLRSLYDHPFHINLIFPKGITDNPCPGDSGGLSFSKIGFLDLSITLNKMTLKILIVYV